MRFRRVAPNRWVAPRSDYALDYRPDEGHYVFFRAGKPLFTTQSLSEADESLALALSCRS